MGKGDDNFREQNLDKKNWVWEEYQVEGSFIHHCKMYMRQSRQLSRTGNIKSYRTRAIKIVQKGAEGRGRGLKIEQTQREEKWDSVLFIY